MGGLVLIGINSVWIPQNSGKFGPGGKIDFVEFFGFFWYPRPELRA